MKLAEKFFIFSAFLFHKSKKKPYNYIDIKYVLWIIKNIGLEKADLKLNL